MRPEAFVQTMSTPFRNAFPQYCDIIGLYDTRSSKMNPAVNAYKDRIAERIKNYYQMKDQMKDKQLDYPVDDVKFTTLDPRRASRRVSAVQVQKTKLNMDDKASSHNISTISNYINRQQDNDELASPASIYGPYQELNKGLVDEE